MWLFSSAPSARTPDVEKIFNERKRSMGRDPEESMATRREEKGMAFHDGEDPMVAKDLV